jgi:cell cycle sensor histidine kinase DivJ
VLRNGEFIGVVRRAFDPFVHGSVATSEVAAKHRGFIATHLISGFVALALIPLSFVFEGQVAAFSAAALAILGCEALVALYVSRTGSLLRGHLLSTGVLTVLAAWFALFTGGLMSFAIVWFAIAPIEAALSGRRGTIGSAFVVSACGLSVVIAVSVLGALPEPLAIPGGMMLANALGSFAALGYAAWVSFQMQGETVRADERADAGESRYQLLADSMTDVVACHGPNGDVVFASPAVERLIGVRPCEIIADGLFRRVHIADRPAYLTAVSEALHKGQAAVEFRLRRGDESEVESWVWVETLLRRMETGAIGAAASVVSVTRDIGHRKLQEAELLKARQDAEASSFAKTHFLANMSHELRTPLNAIIGFSDILSREIMGKFEFDKQREYSTLIRESGEHLLHVVNDILDMSKIEAGSFEVTLEPFELAPVIDRVSQFMIPQADAAGVDVRLALDADLPELVADRRAVRQIVLNLLSNAVKFSHRNGHIVCGARREGHRIALFVRDQGIGIAGEDIPNLGKPFFQADSRYNRRHEGTGLGLSVVKGLATLHGGSMTIDSKLGHGTTVTVHLPINGDREPAPVSFRPQRRMEAAGTNRQAKRA